MNNISKETFINPESEEHFRSLLWDILSGIREDMRKRYVKRVHAIYALIFILGVLFGCGYLTWAEVLKIIK